MGKMVVYLANLGRYNEGILQGSWIKLPANKEALEKVLDEIGINEMYEEYFITVRILRTQYNVEVFFEKENISTFDPKSDMIFTILASVAQEESRNISENCT